MASRKICLILFCTLLFLFFTSSCGRVEGPPQEDNITEAEAEEKKDLPPSTELPESTPSPSPMNAPESMPVPPPENNSVPLPKPKPKQKPKSKSKPAPPSKALKHKKAKKGVVLGSFCTYVGSKNKARIKNIKIAAKEINGCVLSPGETFSFNKVVGERIPQKGYKKANILMGGKYVKGTGGGVCQLSTTLYNAARKSGMLILERHPHSKPVSYVRKGMDATVSYGSLDLKFKNTKKYAVQIRVKVKNKRVYVSIIKHPKSS